MGSVTISEPLDSKRNRVTGAVQEFLGVKVEILIYFRTCKGSSWREDHHGAVVEEWRIDNNLVD